MSESNPLVKVQILGKEYPVSCDPDEQHELLLAARYLDEKTREIRDGGRIIGTERIAVMAALNIAHELLQIKQRRID
jgi:cell division protein ZapA